jgi:Flp pilus assembly protein TadG
MIANTPIRILRALHRCERGSSMVELAILAPVMIFLALGMIDVGRYAYYSIVASSAARAGAQYGAQDLEHMESTAAIQAAASADGQAFSQWVTTAPACMVAVNNGNLTACPTGSSMQPGSVYYVQVTTTGSFHTLFPYPGIQNPVSVTGSSTMRVVNQ